jgi:hypothetical protein
MVQAQRKMSGKNLEQVWRAFFTMSLSRTVGLGRELTCSIESGAVTTLQYHRAGMAERSKLRAKFWTGAVVWGYDIS